MKNKFKKGFTLVELIVVLAIFTILMAAVMSLIDPVSDIFKNTAVSEKTYAYANNIQTYLQSNLEYAESVVVATSDKIDQDGNGVDIGELNALVEQFRKNHFEYTVTTDNGTDTCWLKGNIHVLRLVNGASDPNRGRIMHRQYEFESDKTISMITDPGETYALNEAIFKARDSRYNFNYALGDGKLVPVGRPAGGNDDSTYKAFDRDRVAAGPNATAGNFTLSIVIDKAGKNNQGSIDVTDTTTDAMGNAVTNTYRAFRMPAVLQECPITFTNINLISGADGHNYAPARPFKKNKTDPVTMQPSGIDGNAGESYVGYAFATSDWDGTNNKGSLVYDSIDFDSDIYFIYALSDEMTTGDAVA